MMVLYLLFLLICCIYDLNGQTCGQGNKPVQICTNVNSSAQTTFYVDTGNVPRFQKTSCKCQIYANISRVNISFSFTGYEIPSGFSFQVNDKKLISGQKYVIFVGQSLTLSVHANINYITEGACLIVSSVSKTPFNIACNRTKSNVTNGKTTFPSDLVSHPDEYNEGENENNDHLSIIIPVVASMTAIVSLIVILLFVIYYRRRSSQRNKLPGTVNSTVTKEEDDDYYMTENPMYQSDDNPNNRDYSENDYHYVENVKQNQTNQSQENQFKEGNHYDYSAIQLSSHKGNPLVKKTTESQKQQCNVNFNENTYDTTSANFAHPFQGLNEYHHLGNVGSTKRAAVDTYNTVGNTSRSTRQEGQEESSDYHVTNVRP